jgi:endo-1,4-beta-xylanase
MVKILIVVSFFCAQHSSAQKIFCDFEHSGDVGKGYHYELWTDRKQGNVCMTVNGKDATFKAEWIDVNSFVARVGLKYDTSKTPEQLGEFTADYSFTKSRLEGLAFMGVYGWNVSPLVEYYILEDWNGSLPNFEKKGSITIDGSEYEIRTTVQLYRPSIQGKKKFTQWWSVRKNRRQSGHISVSKHFEAWKKAGATLGRLYEVKLLAEGYKGSGTVEYTKAIVQLNKKSEIGLKPLILKNQRASLHNSGYNSIISLNGRVISLPNDCTGKTNIVNNLTSKLYIYYTKGADRSVVNRIIRVK